MVQKKQTPKKATKQTKKEVIIPFVNNKYDIQTSAPIGEPMQYFVRESAKQMPLGGYKAPTQDVTIKFRTLTGEKVVDGKICIGTPEQVAIESVFDFAENVLWHSQKLEERVAVLENNSKASKAYVLSLVGLFLLNVIFCTLSYAMYIILPTQINAYITLGSVGTAVSVWGFLLVYCIIIPFARKRLFYREYRKSGLTIQQATDNLVACAKAGGNK